MTRGFVDINKTILLSGWGYFMKTSKVLRNLNRGFLLSAVILIGVCVFVILQEMADKKLEPELKTMAQEFIADSDKQIVLPEEYRVFDESGSSDSHFDDDFINKITLSSSVDSGFYSEKPSLRKYSLGWLNPILMTQRSSQRYFTSAKTEIVQFNSFSVYNGKATLSFDVLFSSEILSIGGSSAMDPVRQSETLTFEKEGDKWIITNYDTYRFQQFFN
jgi:hypothetical protein